MGAMDLPPEPPPGLALSPEFWADFLKLYWEKKPVVLREVFPERIMSPEETFQTVLAAFAAYRSGGAGDRPRCYVQGAELADGALLSRLFPSADDGSLDRYAERVTRALEGRPFGVVINSAHVHSRPLWYRLRSFLRGLYAHTGLPASRTDPAMFLGTYGVTPFGVHTDPASVFTFNLLGEKRMQLWQREYFRDRGTPMIETRLLEGPERFTADAIDLRLGARDLMYWPSSHWHAGVSDGALVCTLGVGVYFESARQELIDGVLRLGMRATGGASVGPLTGPPGALPPGMDAALASVTELVTSGALRKELHAEWLRRLTSDGLQPPPPPVPVQLQAEDRLRLCHGPILTAEVQQGLLISANGYSWTLGDERGRPYDASLVAPVSEAVVELGAGERIRVGPLLRRCGRIAPHVFEVLVGMVAADALNVQIMKR